MIKYNTYGFSENSFVEISDESLIIKNTDNFLDLISNLPSRKIIIYQNNLSNDFFDLSTGVAGEILQKAINYQIRLAIIGDFTKYDSKSLRDFIYESNKQNQIIFLDSLEAVMKRFTK